MNVRPDRRLFQIMLLGLALALGLSACLGLTTTPGTVSTISITNPSGLSPTPTAPAYLVGAWVSENTPLAASGHITVFVSFHHGQVPQPGGQVSLYFHYQNGGGIDALNNQGGGQTTDANGLAAFNIGFGGLTPNIPIGIDVTVQFPGIPNVSEANATSFTVVSVTPTITPSPLPTGGTTGG
jgi:hypothetical protein